MKKPWLAFTLSFLLPGAGLWYLGKWSWGFLNLAIVLGIGFLMTWFLTDEIYFQWINYVAIACSSGSAGLAYALAKQKNEKAMGKLPPS